MSSANASTEAVAALGALTPAKTLLRSLQWSLCACVVLLAIFQFSENTADPDVWGHVLVGQEMWKSRQIAKAETYSWTAQGHPFVYHECGADLLIGGAHALLGGPGLLLLKVVVGLLTFGLCLKLGGQEMAWPGRAFLWLLGGLAVVEISYGFAPRPQIFTALALAIELWILRQVDRGNRRWALGLPLLFLLWINTHGGALAGFGLLGLSIGAMTAEAMWERKQTEQPQAKRILAIWLAGAGATVALFINPWGAELVRWLIGSVLWLRPEIEEWNPTPMGWDHGAFFILVGITSFAWIFSRRPRRWWELFACMAFAVLAVRSVRNTPLFCIVSLALTPPHLVSALERFRNRLLSLEKLFWKAKVQQGLACMFGAAGLVIATSVLTLHKEHPLTIEAPRANYPVGAIQLMEQLKLSGRLLVFFDWGEMAMFHLPQCPPSIDGRLDTCYPRELIAAHWKFYNGEPFDERVLPVDQADLALLPAKLAGTVVLSKRPGWKVIYFDPTAVLLARRPERFPQLTTHLLPIRGEASVSKGREPMIDRNPRWE